MNRNWPLFTLGQWFSPNCRPNGLLRLKVIAHVRRCIKILTWLRGFRIKIANFLRLRCLAIPKRVDHSKKYHNIPQCSLLVTPKFCISVVFCFSWEFKWHQEKLKLMLMQNFGVTNEEYYGMLWYFLEWSIKKNDQKASTGCAWLGSIRDMSIAWWVVTPLTPWSSYEATQHLTHLMTHHAQITQRWGCGGYVFHCRWILSRLLSCGGNTEKRLRLNLLYLRKLAM